MPQIDWTTCHNRADVTKVLNDFASERLGHRDGLLAKGGNDIEEG
jgi:hypothetical protein